MLAIIMAATDTIAGELNSLSTATVIDFYKRWAKPTATDAHYLTVSKIATGVWGLFACAVAVWAAELGSLIEVVNRFGSFFYGSILGVFILAIARPVRTGNGAFVGLIAGMSSVAWVASSTTIAFLWQNVVGAVAVVVAGTVVSGFSRNDSCAPNAPGSAATFACVFQHGAHGATRRTRCEVTSWLSDNAAGRDRASRGVNGVSDRDRKHPVNRAVLAIAVAHSIHDVGPWPTSPANSRARARPRSSHRVLRALP